MTLDKVLTLEDIKAKFFFEPNRDQSKGNAYFPSTNSTVSLLNATNKSREKTPVMSQREVSTGETIRIFQNKKRAFDPKMFLRSESAASIDLLKLR
jgi:hypothetical protein